MTLAALTTSSRSRGSRPSATSRSSTLCRQRPEVVRARILGACLQHRSVLSGVKIAAVKTFVVGNPPPHYGGRYFIFLKLVTDDGIEGVGEAYAATFGPHTVAA